MLINTRKNSFCTFPKLNTCYFSNFPSKTVKFESVTPLPPPIRASDEQIVSYLCLAGSPHWNVTITISVYQHNYRWKQFEKDDMMNIQRPSATSILTEFRRIRGQFFTTNRPRDSRLHKFRKNRHSTSITPLNVSAGRR